MRGSNDIQTAGNISTQPNTSSLQQKEQPTQGQGFGRAIEVVSVEKQIPQPSQDVGHPQSFFSERKEDATTATGLSRRVSEVPVKAWSAPPTLSMERDDNVFLVNDGKISQLRRTSLEQPPSPKHRRSFESIAKALKNASAFVALAPNGIRMSDHVVMGMDKVAGYENQGIPRSYLERSQQVANETETIVSYRPVELICRTLIEEGAESKGLNIKGKSSNWGPMAGFIPFDQKFSKLASIKDPDKQDTEVAKYNAKNVKSVEDGHATVEHLSLTQRRMDELTELNILHDFQDIPPAQGYTKAVTLMSNPKGLPPQTFEAHRNAEGKWDIFSGSGDEREKLMVIPKTADFDLLFAFSPYDQVDLGGADRLHDFHPELGILSTRNETLIDALNAKFDRGPGKNMVHHGDDTKNPVTDMKANIPATVFIPESLFSRMGVYNESPVLIKTYDELVRLFRTMRDAGMKVESNPLWEEMKEVVKEPFSAKLALYESKVKGSNPSRRPSAPI
ncbi:anthrax toxin-like adenylyl cyclase domain-containing protein [Sansalvadorimonas verongulae]|uniref:anthrax toxin-like adenylyl cyclase domain-containing protein n=1 Tax=Sansalvadorimonas verongulae TaxID=2172824 RepID=UPI0012BBCC7F|nr:anthrax toxin-like adenylyl cyclase domain-containing protein [Sansalvadorimonas verongulae]MTI15576.1 hypothetical protein [Sansalvadorimonas verongulae]